MTPAAARRALGLALALAVCGAAGSAAAQAIAPPAGWKPQPVKLAPPRPDVVSTAVETYFPPGDAAGGARPAVLYVTRIERKAAPVRRDAIAAGELEEIFAAQRRQGANTATEASTRRADPAAKQLEAALTWRDASLGMVDTSRVVVAADAERVVAVTGQCLLAAGAAAELAKACEAALATLDPGIPAAARVPLAMSAEPAPVAAPMPAAAGSGGGAAAGATGEGGAAMGPAPEPARLGDASHVELPARTVRRAERAADRRPLYIGAGLVALAMLFWLNRRRRERLEADEKADEARDDDDDEDLHAAADAPAEPKKEKDE